MHIHYNTNQTTLPLESRSFLSQDYLVFTIEKVVNILEDSHFPPSIMPLVARLSTLKCLYLLFYLPLHKGFSLLEKLKK
ncbi:transposase [Streptococcus pneumoniae]|nr:transposase [Streptococcus pneumoniae]